MNREEKSGMTNPCEGCFHWRGRYYGDICCNYIFDMDRNRPCPPGADCTERIDGFNAYKKKIRSQSQAPELSPRNG